MEKTVLTPQRLYEDRNSSDIFDREIIAGVLKVLNRKLIYSQIWDETEGKTEFVTVPFFYNFGGNNINSERFVQDNYLFFGENECTDIGLKKIDGNFDFYPRGVLSMESGQIDAGSITNRFVMGRYQKKESDGTLKMKAAQLYSIPMSFSFKCEIKCSTMTEAMKITQAYREFFYKNKTFRFNYKGMQVPGRIGFPESQPVQTPESYTAGGSDQKQYISVTFSLSVESYQPVFDKDTEMDADASISGFGLGIGVEGKFAREGDRLLKPVNDISGATLTAGAETVLEWTYSFSNSDLLSVTVTWTDDTSGEETVIDTVANNNRYFWTVPSDMGCIEAPDLIIPNTDTVTVHTPPAIRMAPDLKTKKVTPSDITVTDKGFFLTDMTSVNGYISYKAEGSKLQEIPVKINLVNNMLAPDNTFEFKSFAYKGAVNPVTGSLTVADTYNKKTKFTMTGISII